MPSELVRPPGFEPGTCGLRAYQEACLEGYRDDSRTSEQGLSISTNFASCSGAAQLLGFLLG